MYILIDYIMAQNDSVNGPDPLHNLHFDQPHFDYLELIAYDDFLCQTKLQKYFEFCDWSNDHYSFYAITLTLHPAELRVLKENKQDPFNYLHFKLDRRGYTGVIVSEFTKKRCAHVHGIVIIPKTVIKELNHNHGKISKKYINSYDPHLGSSNVIKPLSSRRSLRPWIKYLGKCYASPTVIDYYNKFSEYEKDNIRSK